MHRLFGLLLLLLSFVACGLGDSRRGDAERVGASKSAVTSFDFTPEDAAYSLNVLGITTVGQVLTVPADDPRLRSFTVRMHGEPAITYRGELYAWNVDRIVGPPIYESGARVGAGGGLAEVVFDLDAVPVLSPGGKYVFVVTIAKDPNDAAFTEILGARNDDPYADGAAFVGPNDPATWATTAWTTTTRDLAFAATFDKASTTTSLSSTPNPSVFGQTVTLTATVTGDPSLPAPSGTVTFSADGESIGSANLNAGVATLTVSNLPVGQRVLGASYAGAGPHGPSAAPSIQHSVGKASTSTVLVSSADPAPAGDPITFTATVTADAPGAGVPTGTVTFKEGGTTLGTGTLDNMGKATLTTSSLPVGEHTITAEYAGDASFLPSTADAITQDVAAYAVTIALDSTPNPSAFGATVTFSVTVSGPGPTPTGTVRFKEGPIVLGEGPLAGGVATVATSNLVPGTHTISVEYSGDTSYGVGTATRTHVVSKAPTTTTLVSSTNPAAIGERVLFTASVASTTPGVSGVVTFYDGALVLGSANLVSGAASFSTEFVTGSPHLVSASYAGNDIFAASSSAVIDQKVEPRSDADGGAPPAPEVGEEVPAERTAGSGGCGASGRPAAPSASILGIALVSLAIARRRRRTPRTRVLTSDRGTSVTPPA